MATRTKIILTKAGAVTEYLLTPGMDWETALFSTSEYVDTRIKFVGHKSDKLWFEHIDETEGVLLLPGKTLHLISNERSYVPGSFVFKWYRKDETFEGSFKVESHHLEQDTVEAMYQALESRIYGITRNQHALAMLQSNEDRNDEIQRLLLLFSTYHHELTNHLIDVSLHPQEVMTNEYQRTQTSKRPTAKSLRWQASKGAASGSIQYFEPAKQISYDTAENQYLKHMLVNMRQKMDKIRQINHENTLKQQQLKQEITAEIKEIRATKQSLGTGKNVDVLIYDLNTRLRFRNETLQQITTEMAQNKTRYQPIFNLYAKISQLLNEPWLKSVTLKYRLDFPKKILNLNHYRALASFYQRYIIHEEEVFRYPRNQTSLLFEYFCLFLVQEILESCGFKCLGKQDDVPLDERVRFKHASGRTIYLSYDRFIGDLTLARGQKQAQLVSVIGGSRRPDILLELYDETDEFERAFIIEAKYRRLHNIYKGDVNTNVLNQLNVYSTFKYYRPDQLLSTQADVTKIVVIYPQHQDARYFKEPVLGYDFIPIVPTGFSLSAPSFEPLIKNIEDFLI